MRRMPLSLLLALPVAVGCGDGDSDDGSAGATGTDSGVSASGGNASGGEGPGSSGGQSGSSGSNGSGNGGGTSATGGSAGTDNNPAVPTICTPPISLVDVSNPNRVVGTGAAASCTESALRTAVEQGGTITFNCGTEPVVIELNAELRPPHDTDTVIDGDGRVTLDAGKRSRHLVLEHGNWMVNTSKLVLQGLTLVNGKAPTGQYFPQDSSRPRCAYGYKEGSGGSVYVRDSVLHVIDCSFHDNEAAPEGPDVGGGAIYALGSKEVIISGSRFIGNHGANGGAVGMLFANPKIHNSVFENNVAKGKGMNYVESGCPNFNHDEQGGAGGLAGAVYFDGMNDDGWQYTICGSVFRNNRANELAGALFRTPNTSVRQMLIDRSLFDGNTARTGGVSFIKQNDLTVRDSLFMHNRGGLDIDGSSVGGGSGGLWVNEGTLDLANTTFYDNSPGGLTVEGSGVVRNATFVDSRSDPDLAVYNSVFSGVGCESSTGSKNVRWPQTGTCPSDTVNQDPELGDLADNGGPTLTFLPSADSPVLGIGTNCPETDQRGQPRTSSGCDAGAVER